LAHNEVYRNHEKDHVLTACVRSKNQNYLTSLQMIDFLNEVCNLLVLVYSFDVYDMDSLHCCTVTIDYNNIVIVDDNNSLLHSG